MYSTTFCAEISLSELKEGLDCAEISGFMLKVQNVYAKMSVSVLKANLSKLKCLFLH